MITHVDEILQKAVGTDTTAVPRYNLVRPDGTVVERNVALKLANAIAQDGTPINKALLDELLSASGVTAGTATAYTLAQEGYELFDGAPVRFQLHTASDDGATLNINGTGAKPVVDMMGEAMAGGIPAGTRLTAMYSAAAGAYVLAGGEAVRALYGERYAVDDAVAYTKDVPEDALPYAEVGEVGGMTYKVNMGTEAAPVYELRSAAATEMVSVGANLLPVTEGYTLTIPVISGNNHLSIYNNLYLEAGTYQLSFRITSGGDSTRNTPILRGETTPIIYVYAIDNAHINEGYYSYTIVIPKSEHYNVLWWVQATTVEQTVSELMLNKGTTALPYTPYVRNTLPIPDAVQALDGYGEGNPDDVTEYNAIKWLDSGERVYSHKGNIVDGAWIPLDAEEITDISSLLPADNILPVEAGGTITAVNEHGEAVPSTITFQRNTLANRASTYALEKLRLALELLASIDYVDEAIKPLASIDYVDEAIKPLATSEAVTAALNAAVKGLATTGNVTDAINTHKAESAAHNAASIVTDSARQFVSAAEKAAWNEGTGGNAKVLSNTRITTDSSSVTIDLPTGYNYFRIILSEVATTDNSSSVVRCSLNASSLTSSGLQLGAGDSEGDAFVMHTESNDYVFNMLLYDSGTFGSVTMDIARFSSTTQGACRWATDGNGSDAAVCMAMSSFSASGDATSMTISVLGGFYLKHGMGITVIGVK